jgi:hypothetical protein
MDRAVNNIYRSNLSLKQELYPILFDLQMSRDTRVSLDHFESSLSKTKAQMEDILEEEELEDDIDYQAAKSQHEERYVRHGKFVASLNKLLIKIRYEELIFIKNPEVISYTVYSTYVSVLLHKGKITKVYNFVET